MLSLNAYLISEQDSSQRFITVTLEDITEREQSRQAPGRGAGERGTGQCCKEYFPGQYEP